jgi:hypothetical protein
MRKFDLTGLSPITRRALLLGAFGGTLAVFQVDRNGSNDAAQAITSTGETLHRPGVVTCHCPICSGYREAGKVVNT